jgi:hypothetical protein
MSRSVKQLKFATPLISLILSGEKTSTWRLFDDKDLRPGDMFEILEQGTLRSFGLAEITSVTEKPLGELNEEDKKGHEKFANDEEMYATYKNYYQQEVTPQTMIKLIFFKRIASED